MTKQQLRDLLTVTLSPEEKKQYELFSKLMWVYEQECRLLHYIDHEELFDEKEETETSGDIDSNSDSRS